jgi:ATP phosphoribosyltransferase
MYCWNSCGMCMNFWICILGNAVLFSPVPRPGIGKTGRFAGQLRVATKFPNIAAAYFRQRGTAAEIIKLNGAVELAPNVGLADMIVDIVSTGQTLAANNLEVIDEIFTTTARLIANRASYRLKTAGTAAAAGGFAARR